MGPAKLSENTKILRRLPTLADDFYFAAPGTGTGGVSVLSNLLSLLAGSAPVETFADITTLLAGATPIKYFAFVTDAEDDPVIGLPVNALYIRLGADPTDLDDYVLIWSASAVSHFKGVYASAGALTTAYPTADPGDYALVDVGSADAQLYIWDDTDTDWVASGATTVVPDADASTKGIAKLYPSTSLGTNTDGAPTQNAVKVYVDNVVVDEMELAYTMGNYNYSQG